MTTYQNETLNEREGTHGDYAATAAIAQELKAVLSKEGRTFLLPAMHRESLDLICTKIARVLSGNHDEADHWKDIAGYASLIAERLK